MSVEKAMKVFLDAENPVLYLGAGISRGAPSNVPLFRELMSSYLHAIDPPDVGILRNHAGKEWYEVHDLVCELPTEEFFADISFLLGKAVFQPLDWFNERPTNQSHKHIASLVRDLGIRTILTPNFDRLLEKILPQFEHVVDMKPLFRNESLEVHPVLETDLPDYLDSGVRALFHLHGTIGASVLDISPAATATPYNHFDHANLEPRLKGATVLFAGCSGAYDSDVVDLLLKCDPRNGVWIRHRPTKHEVTGIGEVCEFPKNWRGIFWDSCYAIRGETTRILAALAGNAYSEETAEDVSEFREHLTESLGNLERKQRLLGLVNFVNQIERGDIALSILGEFEHEDLTPDTRKSKQIDLDNRLLLATCDSIELNDGKQVDAEEYRAEYEKEAEVFFRFRDAMWPLAVGRARAIAVSRNPLASRSLAEAIEIIRNEVMEVLRRVVPFEEIGAETVRWCPQVVREWMLAFESLGVFYLEDWAGTRAIECFDKALSICKKRDDFLRISKARHVAGFRIGGPSVLTTEEEDLMQQLLDEPDKTGTEMDRVNKLMEIADKLYFAEGNHAKCEEMYQALTAKYPNNVEACLNFSNLIRVLGDPARALRELERGMHVCGDDYRLLCNQGRLLNEMGRQRQAESVLLNGIRKYPYDSYTWNNLGNSYYELGDLEGALEAYEKAVTLEPACPDAEDNLAKTTRRIIRMKKTGNDRDQARNVMLTGTCRACGRRFKIPAVTVLATDNLTCPHPGCHVDWDTTKLKIIAKALLENG